MRPGRHFVTSQSMMETQKLLSNMGQIALIMVVMWRFFFFLVKILMNLFRKLAKKIKSVTHSQRNTPNTD